MLFDVNETRSQQGRVRRNFSRRKQGQRLINEVGRGGRNQAIRTVIGLGADLTRVLASRRDIITGAMFDRQYADRRPQEESEAGEESGTGNGH
jgi:hypothetical protein